MGVLLGILFIGAAVVLFFRYREHFYALESATDSEMGHFFWTALAVVFAIALAVVYFVFLY